MNSDEFHAQVNDCVVRHNVPRRLNPFASSHLGVWEAVIRSCKHYLKRVISDKFFTLEEL